jgi:hypothetical protein
MRLTICHRAGVLAMVLAAGHGVPAAATVTDGAQPAPRQCVSAEEARAHAAGADGAKGENATPRFTRAFVGRTFTLDASLDGLDGNELPISIEAVCDVPRSLRKQAIQLAGGGGIARLSTTTQVWLDGRRLEGSAATTAIEGADTAVLRVRLRWPARWGEDQDGNKVATFKTRRITITD